MAIIRAGFIAGVTAAVLAAASLSPARAEYKIGFVTSLSGAASTIGIPYSRGIAAAKEYMGEISGEPISVIQLDDGSAPSGQEQQLRTDELLYLHPESLAALPQSARLDRALSTLLKISTAIGSIRDVDSLQWQLLGMIFDVIPAERGAILLSDDNAAELSSPVAWDRVSGPDHPVHVSRSLVRRVIKDGVAILDNEVCELGSTSDDHAPRVRALLCVPLAVAGRALGTIYLDSANPSTSFTKDDLQLLAAIAGVHRSVLCRFTKL